MSNAHSFPLPSLPHAALENVLKIMKVWEKLQYSTLSQNSLCAVKQVTKHHKFLFSIEFTSSVSVVIGHQTGKYEFDLKYCGSTFDIIKSLLTQITGAFQDLAFRLKIRSGAPMDLLKKFYNLVDDLNLSFEQVMVTSYEADQDELCRAVFENCKRSRQLSIILDPSPGFQLNLKDKFEVQELTIVRAHYFTVIHLILHFMSCSDVKLHDGKLSVIDLNLFLRYWIQKSEIKNFHYSHGVYNGFLPEALDHSVLFEIECVPVQRAIWKRRHTVFPENQCFLIRQEGEGGGQALVWFIDSTTMELTTDFVLKED